MCNTVFTDFHALCNTVFTDFHDNQLIGFLNKGIAILHTGSFFPYGPLDFALQFRSEDGPPSF